MSANGKWVVKNRQEIWVLACGVKVSFARHGKKSLKFLQNHIDRKLDVIEFTLSLRHLLFCIFFKRKKMAQICMTVIVFAFFLIIKVKYN